MTRFAFLVAALLTFTAVPAIARHEAVPPKWRLRLALVSVVGMAATSAVLLAGILLPEVLVISSVRDLWATCSAAFRDIFASPLARSPSLVAGAALVVLLGRMAWSIVGSLRAIRTAAVKWDTPRWRLADGSPVYVLPLGDAEAYSAGLLAAHVVVSQGLLDVLDEEEREAALRHEEAHIRGKHQLLLLWARAAAAAVHPLPPARAAMRLVEQGVEESADQYAATKVGDPATVASGLAKAALAGLRGPVGAVPLGGPDVPARVRRLLAPPRVPRWLPPACFAATLTLAGILALTQLIGGLALVAALHHVIPIGMATYCPVRR